MAPKILTEKEKKDLAKKYKALEKRLDKKNPDAKTKTPPRESIKVSSSVRVKGASGNVVNEKLASGADKAKADNARSIAKTTAADKKALKAANKPTNKTGSKMNKAERTAWSKVSPAEQKAVLKYNQELKLKTRAAGKPSVSKMKPVPSMGGRGRMRIGGGGGALRLDDMNR